MKSLSVAAASTTATAALVVAAATATQPSMAHAAKVTPTLPHHNHYHQPHTINNVASSTFLSRHPSNIIPRGGASQPQNNNDEETNVGSSNADTPKASKKSKSRSKSKKKRQRSNKSNTNDTVKEETSDSSHKDTANAGDTIDTSNETSTNNNNNVNDKTSDKRPETNISETAKSKNTKPTKQKTSNAKTNNNNNTINNDIVEQILKQDDYYQILGVSKKSATAKDIKKAYRKRAVQTHPDKTGGDRRAFDKVAEAYNVLSDETKKQVYDRFGKRGLSDSANGMGSSFASAAYEDMFRNMFYRQRQQQQHHRPRNRTVRYQLGVTLEQLYQGLTKNVTVNLPNSSLQKDVQVHVPKGSLSGQSIVLSGENDLWDDASPGDVVFILSQVQHPVFTRKGHDLALELTITLQEAICGVKRSIFHLDGNPITIASPRKKISNLSNDSNNENENDNGGDSESVPILINHGDVHVLKGKGMPKKNKPNEFGDLYVQFVVEMPKGKNNGELLTPAERQELGRLLSKLQGSNGTTSSASTPNDDDKDNVYYLQPSNASAFGRASGPVEADEDEHDEHHNHHHHHGYDPRSQFFFGSSQFHTFTGGSPFGQNPFGGDGGDNNDANVQCQQM